MDGRGGLPWGDYGRRPDPVIQARLTLAEAEGECLRRCESKSATRDFCATCSCTYGSGLRGRAGKCEAEVFVPEVHSKRAARMELGTYLAAWRVRHEGVAAVIIDRL
jgi:hypothetical protein